ncbi:MAG TPA: tetratricopeptide repeat protein, partial [Polyangiaceae bacterium LLY-WYZ-15_(1-7)]|nr:tetratricopeptide repeat protein [Polyangiaceae bacterium LLY-WYZ-15_(1-7)]
KPASASSGLDELDLPAPKKPATPFDDMVEDLPAPLRSDALDGMDLPAPKKPAAPAQPDFGDDLDLPMPKGGGGASDLDLDLPMPKGGGSGAGDLDLDLPMPKGGGSGASDLDLDLPMPKGGGGGAGDLDLDLPAPKGDAGFGDLDLPAPKDDLDLPAPKGEGGFGDLDLPAPKGDFDLDLPAPSENVDLPAAADDGLPGLGLDDDLSLPEPRERAPGAAPDGRAGAGGASFGEIDLGGGDAGEPLEFADLPEEEGDVDVDLDAVGGMDLPAGGLAPVGETPAKKRRKKPAADAGPKKKKSKKGLAVFAAVLLLLAGAGVALKWTPYGIFGVHFLEQFRAEAGDASSITTTLQQADEQAAPDTWVAVRQALRTLADARRETYLNRRLLARSAVHEALFQVRFGENARSQGREEAILQRLETRGNDAPGIHLALAAHALREGNLGAVPGPLSKARQEAPDDAYVHLVAGEHALAGGQADAAAEAFQAAVDAGAGARGRWGLARAEQARGDAEAFATAVRATLEASPRHASALIASAELAHEGGDEAEAIAQLERAAGRAVDEGSERIRASAGERARAWALLGQMHEEAGRRGQARSAYEAAIEADPFAVGALLGLGRVLLGERQFQGALTRFQAAEEAAQGLTAPEGEEPYALQAGVGRTRALLQLDQVQQAHSTMQQLAQAHPENPEVALWLGKALEALERDEEAVAAYERAIELQPDQFDGYLALAQLHFANEAPEQAAEALQRAREAVEETAQVRRMMGESELRRGRLAQAEREFRGALEMEPENTAALYGLGVTLRRAGRLAEAGRTLAQLSEIDSAFPGLALERGRIYEALGQAERAVRSYERALEQKPDDLDLVLRLGAAQVAAGQLDAAETSLQRVMAERADSAEAEHFMGRVALARGELPTALQHLARAVRLDPQRAEFHLYFGEAQLESNALGRAIEEVQTALELDDTLAQGYFLRGRVGLRSGAVRDARDDFLRALQLAPGLHAARAGLGEAYDQLGERGDAVRAYEQAVAGDATKGEWWYRLGRLRLDAGRRAEALGALVRATELGDALEDAPRWLANAHRWRAEAHRLGGQRGDAIRHYERYLELAPASDLDRTEVQDRLSRLR